METKIIEEIENLCRKADQTRSIHGMIKDRFVLLNKIVLLYTTIGSAIAAMLIFAPTPSNYQIYIGIFLASIFIVSIIPGALNFDLEILKRSMAVNYWGEWVRDAKNFCNVDIFQMSHDNVVLYHKKLLNEYKKAMDNTPLISDDDFIKYKRLHLQKIAISKALDKTPFKEIAAIKKDLSSKE
ncbi:MAG: hypothetical protein PHR47_02585 [Candidatus Pacebacteria bacterium]|nr:hypothetical protein [Candidatus Paceibacterota bacterium]